MSNQYVKTDSFRQKIVNKRVDPDYLDLQELLTDFRPAAIEDNQVVQWYVILNECIYNEDVTGFKITHISGGQEVELPSNQYTVNETSAVVTFVRNLNPQELNNLKAYYKGGGSIIWAEDVTDLQKVITTMDSNAVYTDGSNPMTADLFLGSGTQENPYHNIKNVNLVDGIKVSRHNHTGVQTSGVDIGKDYGAPIPTAGIENNAITEFKIATNAVTNSKIKSNAITNIKVSDSTLTANKFNDVAIGGGLKRVSTTIDGVLVDKATLQANVDNKTITINNGALFVPAIINLTGIVLPYAGKGTLVPQGWLLCDGSTYSISQYNDLYQVIGTTYGGDGINTFKVPNFVDKTFWGGVNNDGIANQELAAGLPNIIGTFITQYNSDRSYSSTQGLSGSFFKIEEIDGGDGGNGRSVRVNFDAGSGATTKRIYRNNCKTVQPPAIRMKFIIKT